MYNAFSSPMLENCTFDGNLADDCNGGGIYNKDSSPTLTDCVFSDNAAVGGSGGAIYNQYGSPTITRCIFDGNWVTGNSGSFTGGGGMFSTESDPSVTDCTFIGNSAPGHGGGLIGLGVHPAIGCTFSENSAMSGGGVSIAAGTLIGCTFTANTATRGGAAYIAGGESSIIDCVFGRNRADENGGGLCNEDGDPTLLNCRFIGNSAEQGGGGLCSEDGHATLVNCTLSGNSAMEGGGGHSGVGDATLANCTFVGNSAQRGGGVYDGEGSTMLDNCIVWGNVAPDGWQICGSTGTAVAYSCVQGGWPGEGNIVDNPLLVDADGPDGVYGTEDDDLHLLDGSPCVNAGHDRGVPPDVVTDCDGDDRIQVCRVDMGADETPFFAHDCNENDVPDACDIASGTSFDCNGNGIPDECDLADGTSVDADGDGVLDECESIHNVTQDTFHETIQLAINQALDGDAIDVGPGTYCERINLLGKAVRLRGVGGPDVTFIDGEQNGTVVTCNSGEGLETVIEGFTVTGGFADFGGGIRCYFSSPTLINCHICGNLANREGGGMHNHAYSDPKLIHCKFSGNSADSGGGLCNSFRSDPTVVNCAFSGNWAGLGAAIDSDIGCPTLTNCVIWDNAAPDGQQIGGPATVTYSCVEGGWEGDGNIDADPRLVDADGPDDVYGTPDDNLRLMWDSPCIDAGSNLLVPLDEFDLDHDGDTAERLPLDLDGILRFSDRPGTDDTGVADPPDYPLVVDMGAYEYGIFADLDGDCAVGLSDLAQLLGNYRVASGMSYADGDLDGDGDVDLSDLAALLGVYRTVCP